VPQNSCPMIKGGVLLTLWFLKVSNSLPHIPHAATLSNTSLLPITGTG
jgi:hypothetical protein